VGVAFLGLFLAGTWVANKLVYKGRKIPNIILLCR
jgi:hypothetical protein